jgi:hypothetical protein
LIERAPMVKPPEDFFVQLRRLGPGRFSLAKKTSRELAGSNP